MSHDQGFYKVMWISLDHALQTIDYDYKKSWMFFSLGPFVSCVKDPKIVATKQEFF